MDVSTCIWWGILYLFTVRFLLYDKTLYCQTGCYKACFVLIFKIIIHLIRQFVNNFNTCRNFYRTDFIPTNEEASFFFCLGQCLCGFSIDCMGKNIVLFHKYCLSEYAVQVHVLFYGPKITTYDNSIWEKLHWALGGVFLPLKSKQSLFECTRPLWSYYWGEPLLKCLWYW